MNQIINDSKAHILNCFFENIILDIQLSYVCSSGHHQSFFLDFRFSSRKSQSQQKLAKEITHFFIRFNSKHLTYFVNLNSHDIENNMLPKHNKKPFSLYKFSSKHVCVWCQKKKISLRNFFSQRCSKILSGGIGVGWRLNNFLKGPHWLDLVKCFTIFHLN